MSAENKRQIYVPPGFAHGFVTLTDAAVCYKVSAYYNHAGDSSVNWNDPDIGIEWPIHDPNLSDKDRLAPRLKDIPRDKFCF